MKSATTQAAVYVAAGLFALGGADALFGAERHPMPPRVPADKLAEARALANPLPALPDVIERGQALYEGKGGCVNCHGKSGLGDGPVAGELNPSPRNFHHHGFWRHRTDGEIFRVIKNGSPGTAMIGFADQLADEEIWAVMRYLGSFSGGRSPRAGGMRGGACCKENGGAP